MANVLVISPHPEIATGDYDRKRKVLRTFSDSASGLAGYKSELIVTGLIR